MNLASINLLSEYYNVTDTPAVIFNDKTYGFVDKQKAEEIIGS